MAAPLGHVPHATYRVPIAPFDCEASIRIRTNARTAAARFDWPVRRSLAPGRWPHNGYLTPVSRLIIIAWTTSRATPASRTTRYAGLLTSPRDTINVVAAAGGWGTFRRIISAPVERRDSAAARILAQPNAVTVAGPACWNPVTQSDAHPQMWQWRDRIVCCVGSPLES
jgi:hypothetical protein